MNHMRCTFGAVVSPDGRYIYALGGYDGSAINSVERYDCASEKWEYIEGMGSKRYMHSAGCCLLRTIEDS